MPVQLIVHVFKLQIKFTTVSLVYTPLGPGASSPSLAAVQLTCILSDQLGLISWSQGPSMMQVLMLSHQRTKLSNLHCLPISPSLSNPAASSSFHFNVSTATSQHGVCFVTIKPQVYIRKMRSAHPKQAKHASNLPAAACAKPLSCTVQLVFSNPENDQTGISSIIQLCKFDYYFEACI